MRYGRVLLTDSVIHVKYSILEWLRLDVDVKPADCKLTSRLNCVLLAHLALVHFYPAKSCLSNHKLPDSHHESSPVSGL